MTFTQTNELIMLISNPQLFHWSCIMAKPLIGWDDKGCHPQYCVRDCNNSVLYFDRSKGNCYGTRLSFIYEEKIQCWIRQVLTMFYYVVLGLKYFYFSSAARQHTKNSQCLQSVGCEQGHVICDLCQESLQKCFLFNTSQALWVLSVACCRLGSNFGGLWEKAFHWVGHKNGGSYC